MPKQPKDKLNRLYGTDYKQQYETLINQVDNRLKFLIKTFPDIISNENLLAIDSFEIKLRVLISAEKQIQEKYNNHHQGNLFNNNINEK
jgi:hypothetical protein